MFFLINCIISAIGIGGLMQELGFLIIIFGIIFWIGLGTILFLVAYTIFSILEKLWNML